MLLDPKAGIYCSFARKVNAVLSETLERLSPNAALSILADFTDLAERVIEVYIYGDVLEGHEPDTLVSNRVQSGPGLLLSRTPGEIQI